LNSFEERNISNISPIIKVDISINPIIIEHILFGVYYSLEEDGAYKALFQEICDIVS
jgi:hypothetical protein